MNKLSIISAILLLLFSCNQSQTQSYDQPELVGGPCEGCEAVFEYGNRTLNAVDTLPDFDDPGPKLKITGTIYQPDGETPAKGVILYVYHTDQNGIYATKGDEKGWGRRHGYIRGWIKTGKDGRYAFYTLRPGVYPDRSQPAHIHPIILEPGGKYYWLGSYLFNDDPLLTSDYYDPDTPRGGSSGVLDLERYGNIYIGERDYILGENVPGY